MINNQTSRNDQFHPRLSVDETNGNLVVVYYDTVADPTRLKTDIWTQSSSDDGRTWSDPVRVTIAETDETGGGADLGNQYGDYIGLSGYMGTFFPSWTDRRNSASEEIWTASITLDPCLPLINSINALVDEIDAIEAELNPPPGGGELPPAERARLRRELVVLKALLASTRHELGQCRAANP